MPTRFTHTPLKMSPSFFLTGQSQGGGLAISDTLSAAQWMEAYSDDFTITGGTPPYAISGLPYGLSSDLPASPAAISGTPL